MITNFKSWIVVSLITDSAAEESTGVVHRSEVDLFPEDIDPRNHGWISGPCTPRGGW